MRNLKKIHHLYVTSTYYKCGRYGGTMLRKQSVAKVVVVKCETSPCYA